eukprot:scaffold73529_cov45-Prasinocladus_malaysianus.AAC.1
MGTTGAANTLVIGRLLCSGAQLIPARHGLRVSERSANNAVDARGLDTLHLQNTSNIQDAILPIGPGGL